MDNDTPSAVGRRGFLKLAGLGGAVAAGAGGLKLGAFGGTSGATNPAGSAKGAEQGVVNFRAVGALPKAPLPSFASQVVEGTVDVSRQSGVLTSTIFAGPNAPGPIALPGFGRSVRVTGVEASGATLNITGIVDDRSQLQPGESQQVSLRLDRAKGLAWANVHGTEVELNLVP